MMLYERAVRLLSQFIDAVHNLLSPRRSTLTNEQNESIARSLAFLSARTSEQPKYTAEEFFARYMKPVADARAEALKKVNRPPRP
jgi:hypothetical protein